jgi:hypothetical protein
MRFVAGAAACLLMVTGAFILWQSHATSSPSRLPAAPPAARPGQPVINLARIPDAPSADPKHKEQKRFDRADKNKDGTVTLAELVEPRRKPFAKLDLNQDGKLSFEEWTVRTSDKFKSADADKSGGLTRAEYATTAPKRKPRPQCGCGAQPASAAD